MHLPRMGLPHTYGWVRSPEHDTPWAECWEMPNGEHYFVAKGKSFCVVQFDGHLPVAKVMRTKSDNGH